MSGPAHPAVGDQPPGPELRVIEDLGRGEDLGSRHLPGDEPFDPFRRRGAGKMPSSSRPQLSSSSNCTAAPPASGRPDRAGRRPAQKASQNLRSRAPNSSASRRRPGTRRTCGPSCADVEQIGSPAAARWARRSRVASDRRVPARHVDPGPFTGGPGLQHGGQHRHGGVEAAQLHGHAGEDPRRDALPAGSPRFGAHPAGVGVDVHAMGGQRGQRAGLAVRRHGADDEAGMPPPQVFESRCRTRPGGPAATPPPGRRPPVPGGRSVARPSSVR